MLTMGQEFGAKGECKTGRAMPSPDKEPGH